MTQTLPTISGPGLITGQPAIVTVEQASTGAGITFHLGDTVIPARPDFVVNTDRGVTLGKDGKYLAIVEHFLSACAMAGYHDLKVTVSGAPELPLLDGSAQEWVGFLQTHLGLAPVTNPVNILKQPVRYRAPENPKIEILAIPSDHLEISYLVDFPHPDLKNRWFRWRPEDGSLLEAIAPARTFGMASELPALQARGLALGVTPENTLGLTDEGGYTSPLRMPDEALRHKVLDLIGDLMLCGVPIQTLQAQIIVYWGGHTAHLAFGKALAQAL